MLKRRRDKLIALLLLIALASALAGVVTYHKPAFEACAQLKSAALIPIPSIDYTLCILTPFEQIKSQTVLNRMVDNFKTSGLFPDDQMDAYRQLITRIGLQTRGKDTICIFFQDKDPAVARIVVNSLASNFVSATKSTATWSYIPAGDSWPKRTGMWFSALLSLASLVMACFFGQPAGR